MTFCGTLIRILMPLGLALHAVAMLSWSGVLLRTAGFGRAVGISGAACAVATLVLFLAFTHLSGHLLPAVLLAQAVWYLGLAATLFRGCVLASQ